MEKIKLSEQLNEAKQQLIIGTATSKEYSTKKFIKYYDTYRKWSSWFFFLTMIYFFFERNYVIALISFGFMHLHILTNQLWWKLKTIEENYDKGSIKNG